MTKADTTKTESSLIQSASKQSSEHPDKKCNPVSYAGIPFTEKPDSSDTEKRIDAHSLFSMFTANMIKEEIKWFR
ncbi:MAG TPA: hypothetical protein VH396_05035 [Chitinophagaceae bacterium]|jgi:hypothetical protein